MLSKNNKNKDKIIINKTLDGFLLKINKYN